MRFSFTTVRRRAAPVSRALLPLFIGFTCLWFLQQRMGDDGIAAIGPAIARLHPTQWMAAMLATAASFWALGRYDVVIHRHIGTGCPPRQAALTGAASIALGQVLGMGAVVGALVRWRMLPGLRPAQAARIALTVAGWFLVALITIFATTALVSPARLLPDSIAILIILSFLCIALRCFLDPSVTIFGRSFSMLSLPALGSILWLTLLDTAAAALTLWLLLPVGLDIGFGLLFPTYLAALAAALVTGTPGGVGPFELTLLAFLPVLPEAEVMAGVVAFRAVYYAMPGVIAMAILWRPLPMPGDPVQSPLPPLREGSLKSAKRAECGIIRQNGARALAGPGGVMAVASTPQAQVALFDPLDGPCASNLPALRALARSTNRAALIYKATARHAAPCRRRGMKVLHIADEAVLNPVDHCIDGPAHRQLRRKLRQAARAGIETRRAAALPLMPMRVVDAEWQARNGLARGFSMGVFRADYLYHQRVFLAYRKDALVAFASFHVSDHELCLDLMRTGADVPDGTMHALIEAAIRDAAQEGRTRLSLAALPPKRATNPLIHWSAAWSGGPGLTRFKTAFCPRRAPLYALAPSWPGMALALADVARAVHRPGAKPPHIGDENYEFAPARQT